MSKHLLPGGGVTKTTAFILGVILALGLTLLVPPTVNPISDMASLLSGAVSKGAAEKKATSSGIPTTSSATLEIQGDPGAKKLILFTEGFHGNPETTWTNSTGVSWPAMLRQDPDFSEFAIGTLRYDSPLLARTSGIEEVATRLLQILKYEKVFQNYKEIYFVGHSAGGLVLKRMLVGLHRPSQVENLRRVKAVLYISTPAQGAMIAKVASWVSRNPQLQDMRPAESNSYLQILENQWQDLLQERGKERFPRSFCAYETKPTHGIHVVSRVYAATMCDDNPLPVDADHSGIVKPESPRADIYRWAKTHILETASSAGRAR